MRIRPQTVFLFALLLATTAICVSPPKLQLMPQRVIPGNLQVVVRLGRTRVDGGPASFFCTATLLDTTRVLTARHCIDRDMPRVYVVEMYGTRELIPVKVKPYSETDTGRDDDWAVLTTGEKSLPQFDTVEYFGKQDEPKTERIMDSVYTVTYAGAGLKQQVSRLMYIINIPLFGTVFAGIVIPGDSGSPLVNERGQLIGIVARTFFPQLAIGVATPMPKGLH